MIEELVTVNIKLSDLDIIRDETEKAKEEASNLKYELSTALSTIEDLQNIIENTAEIKKENSVLKEECVNLNKQLQMWQNAHDKVLAERDKISVDLNETVITNLGPNACKYLIDELFTKTALNAKITLVVTDFIENNDITECIYGETADELIIKVKKLVK